VRLLFLVSVDIGFGGRSSRNISYAHKDPTVNRPGISGQKAAVDTSGGERDLLYQVYSDVSICALYKEKSCMHLALRRAEHSVHSLQLSLHPLLPSYVASRSRMKMSYELLGSAKSADCFSNVLIVE
jgi:hypothetical protein